METKQILEDRGKDYGSFANLAKLSQNMKQCYKHSDNYLSNMKPYQKEALDMIIHKVARIINGNHHKIDSWQDIAGYATLVVQELQSRNAQNNILQNQQNHPT